ncbi:MAG: HAD-IA family hydrolase, partial [Chitinivibrionales bacterium]|nr:HAD-IA family hydrolase [Chitinivibrionales bacterium]
LGLQHSWFDIVASSEEAGALKPNPRPFLDIASRFSLRPAEILVIGDRDDTDGAAAAACGMRFIRISDKPSLPDSCLRWAAVRERLDVIS